MDLLISLSRNGNRFTARGGDSKGRDKVNAVVASWPGWARVRALQGQSLYAGPLSTTSALALSGASLTLTWEPEARQQADVLLATFEEVRSALSGEAVPEKAIVSSFASVLTSWPATERRPKPYQRQGVYAMMLLEGRCLLSDDMGLGKTSQALWLADMLSGPQKACPTCQGESPAKSRYGVCPRCHGWRHPCDRILVLCPASVKFNWEKEVDLTLSNLIWPTQVIDGTARQRREQFAQLRPLYENSGRLVIIINHDLLKYLADDQISMLARFVKDQLLLIDECHAYKNKKTKRSKIVADHFCPSEGGARWRIGISGTPIRNTVEDLFHQVELVRPGTFHSLHWFLERYTVRSTRKIPFERNGRQLTKILKTVRRAKNQTELNLIMNTMQIRRKKEDVLDLPPKVHTYPELTLDKHTATIYAAMRDYALLLLEEHDDRMPVLSPTCRTAVEAAARCEQISQGCVGGVPDELVSRLSGILAGHSESVQAKPGWLIFPKSTKLVWVQEQIETIHLQGGQVVVFGRFNAPLFWLQERYTDSGFAHGGVRSKNRDNMFAAFQAGGFRTLFVQVRIAEGFNLHAAQDEIFLGRDWAWAVNKQAEDRCHRIGQTGTVNIQIPFVRNTIEVKQHAGLAAKESDADSALCFKTIADLKEALA